MAEDISVTCPCTGLRFCAHCINSERVKLLFSNQVPLKGADQVIANQSEKERTSSCSFAMINKSVKVFEGGITEDEETAIMAALDRPDPFPEWTVSQSGRRLQEYGPKKNFKKKKVKLPDVAGMPCAFKPVIDIISSRTEAVTGTPYVVAEASVLEYTKANLSNFDPHVDDTWLWGDRIVGLNLLEDSAITFVNSDAQCVDVFLPHRGYFLMSGACRHQWMHGIRPENIQDRRISITFRELSPTMLEDPAATRMLLEAAQTFL